MNRKPILISCMFLLLVGCNRAKDTDDETKSETKLVSEVTLTKVERAEIAEDLTVSGNLAALPNHDAKITALVAGRIAKVLVNDGDAVKAGQELAELDHGPLSDAVHQNEASVSQAKANLENAKLAADRNEDLLKRGIAARKDVEDARTQMSVAQASVKQAEAALSTAKTQLARAVVRAPFDGTVVKRFASSGEQVDGTSAAPIVEIADIASLELLAAVPAARLPEIHAGQSFPFDSTSFPGHKFTAHIIAILPAVDPGTNNGVVRMRIDNPEHLMKLGMFVTLVIPVKGNAKRLVVARQAVYPDETGEPHLYKVEGENAESVAVKLGVQTREKVEILSGANEGDAVILTGGYGLPEKSKVKVVKPEVLEEKGAVKEKAADDEKPAAKSAVKKEVKPSPAKK
jgi:membrane fusion protein (multidrug efflux system)